MPLPPVPATVKTSTQDSTPDWKEAGSHVSQNNENAPLGAAPWWNLFDLLIELRVWGPEDRLPISVREALAQKLAGAADGDPIRVEIEIWPSANENDRGNWREEIEAKVLELDGQIVDSSSISERRFIYEALLARIPAGAIRALLDSPDAPNGLAWVKGLQFILPQTVAQAPREPGDEASDNGAALTPFNADARIRAVLLDGLPVAAHPALDGGVVVEDVHELAFRSLVQNRMHGTAMASLILRGDLVSDRVPVPGSRLLSVPIVVDLPEGGRSPEDMLFVDVIHTALALLFLGDERLAPDAFVVNLSIGMQERHFAGQISSLARLLDWWSSEHGVLFVASAGNIFDDLVLPDVGQPAFMAATADDRRNAALQALQVAGYGRRLMQPAEAMNVLTVGAIAEDLAPPDAVPRAADVVRLEADGRRYPALCSALGLGPFRSIKPDLLHSGGVHELRAIADGAGTRLALIRNAPSGLVVASPNFNATPLRRSRGTSCAAALTTRAILQSADALVEEGGPYNGVPLSRKDVALLTRALAVNATDWSSEALAHSDRTLANIGGRKYAQAKEHVARHFGHGYLFPDRMQQSPATGATLVGLGDSAREARSLTCRCRHPFPATAWPARCASPLPGFHQSLPRGRATASQRYEPSRRTGLMIWSRAETRIGASCSNPMGQIDTSSRAAPYGRVVSSIVALPVQPSMKVRRSLFECNARTPVGVV